MADGGRATILVDASALLCRYLPDRRQQQIDDACVSAERIVVTELARTEVELGLHHALGAAQPGPGAHPRNRLMADWDRFWVLPIDQQCLRRASDLGCRYGLNLANALHLAAFDRVPRPATLLTVDDRQIAAAADLGFDVVEVGSGGTSAHQLLRTD